ncbi:MAG TPA: T9SS type A sorting domain-containing protein [Salinivirgaceae bacterium]|nr:T9SS type A sorting domain-containing protein [Salinivirgaceae bacterium]
MNFKFILFAALFFILSNLQGQNNLIRNNKFLFPDEDYKKAELLINQMGNKPQVFKSSYLNPNFQQNSTSAVKQKLDSVVSTYGTISDTCQGKSEYIYNSYGKVIQGNYYRRYINSQWKNSWRDELSYDVNNRLSKESSYSWDSDNNRWKNEEEKNYTYDAYGNLKSEIYFSSWDTVNNKWRYCGKCEYSYDNNSNLILETGYRWDTLNNDWTLRSKTEYSYDSNSNLILEGYYSWDIDSSQWKCNWKNEYSYDINGNLIQYIYYSLNESTNQMYIYYKIEYSYDDYNNMIMQIYWECIHGTEELRCLYKYEYSYDNNNNMIMEIRWEYSSFTNEWHQDIKYEYSYDSNNNTTEKTYFHWNFNENTWIPEEKFEFLYNSSYTFSDIILPAVDYFYDSFEEINLNNMLIEYKEYTMYDGEFSEKYSEKYYYSEITVGIDDVKKSTFNVFPNPASSYIIIQPQLSDNSGVFEFYDIKGNKVISLVFSDRTQVSVSDLQSGIYFYNIISKEGRESGKLVIN